ncbi:MAG: hypothetical protein IJ083_14135 [Clostridia bacterium]|nr:hypothetical protein [Clostridia bacterium]
MDPIKEILSSLEACPQRSGMQLMDAVKFCFQAFLGMGHLLAEKEVVTGYIQREMDGVPADPEEPLTESLGPYFCRVNLRRAKAEGLRAEIIAGLMLHAASAPFSREQFELHLLDIASAWSFPSPEPLLPLIRDQGWLPSHSEEYRQLYRPAYRVIPRETEPLLPALCAVSRAMDRPRLLVTLDGPCASGKTTLAGNMAKILGGEVIHTDDFVIPHAQKTPERLSIPGGNCDAERLVPEVLEPYLAGARGTYRTYDFRNDRLAPPLPLPEAPVLILEGSYCNVPAIRALAGVRLFLDTSFETRMARLRLRESPESLARFQRMWIPLEDAYFTHFHLPDEDCIVIRDTEIQPGGSAT